jgi:hypothetical protein
MNSKSEMKRIAIQEGRDMDHYIDQRTKTNPRPQSPEMFRLRIDWMVKPENLHLWKDIATSESRKFKSPRIRALIEAMQEAGLYSKKTNYFDVRVEKLLKSAEVRLTAMESVR